MNNMHIALCIHSLSAGGAERVITGLANDRARKGAEVTIITVEDSAHDFYPLHPHVKRVVLAKAAKTGLVLLMPWRVLTRLFYLRRAISDVSPDVIISTTTFINALAIVATRGLTIPVCVRETTSLSALIRQGWKGRAARYLYQWLYPCADAVICPSQKIQEALQQTFGLDNTVVLYNPVDHTGMRAAALKNEAGKNATGGGAASVRFICVGRLIAAKGFDRLIEHLQAFSPEQNWHLSILGEGSERGALELLIAEYDLQDRVTLMGLQENPWAPMAAADALLLPSRWEGMPNVALEALALGTPVIAMAEAGGIGEVAALAPEGAVTIAHTMDAFVGAMRRVQGRTERALRPSLLPRAFELETVMAQFEAMIEGVTQV